MGGAPTLEARGIAGTLRLGEPRALRTEVRNRTRISIREGFSRGRNGQKLWPRFKPTLPEKPALPRTSKPAARAASQARTADPHPQRAQPHRAPLFRCACAIAPVLRSYRRAGAARNLAL